MPFSSKYQNLGITEKIRVPVNLIPHVEIILSEYNRICGAHDINFLNNIKDKIEQGLHSVD